MSFLVSDSDLINRISSDFINELDALHFTGQIILLQDPQEMEFAAEAILLQGIDELGFDTESRPSFHRGVSFPISLIQIGLHDRVYLFHLLEPWIPPTLVEIMANPNIRKIGVGLSGDFHKLKQLVDFEPQGFIDLSKIAAQKGIIQTGARSLTARYLNKKLVKAARTTNWARPQLSEKQMQYAATDAWVCLVLLPLLQADTNEYHHIDELAEHSTAQDADVEEGVENDCTSDPLDSAPTWG